MVDSIVNYVAQKYTLQTRTLKPRGEQGESVSEWQNQDSNPGLSDAIADVPQSWAFPTAYSFSVKISKQVFTF